MSTTSPDHWALLDPTVAAGTSGVLSPRLATLDGATIGVIWNGRSPGDLVLDELFAVLRRRHAIGEVVLRAKPHVGNIAPDEILDELAQRCDAVVAGVGDCGSCCPASVADAIAMERRGTPAAMVGAEKLVATVGRGMAKVQGLPDFPLAVIHGSGQLEGMDERNDRDDVVRFAEDLAVQVEAILLTGRSERQASARTGAAAAG